MKLYKLIIQGYEIYPSYVIADNYGDAEKKFKSEYKYSEVVSIELISNKVLL